MLAASITFGSILILIAVHGYGGVRACENAGGFLLEDFKCRNITEQMCQTGNGNYRIIEQQQGPQIIIDERWINGTFG